MVDYLQDITPHETDNNNNNNNRDRQQHRQNTGTVTDPWRQDPARCCRVE